MPFGLKNAPAVFQQLMQLVLRGLNPNVMALSLCQRILMICLSSLKPWMSMYNTWKKVLGRLREAHLKYKLKPTKCHFICPQVEYLGHVLTPEGLKPNPARVSAVKDFPVPNTVSAVR